MRESEKERCIIDHMQLNSHSFISFAGSCSNTALTAADVELKALEAAIACAIQRGVLINHLFLTNADAYKAVLQMQPFENVSVVQLLLISTGNPLVYPGPFLYSNLQFMESICIVLIYFFMAVTFPIGL